MNTRVNKLLTTYQDAWEYLDQLQMHKIKLGLEAMQDILAELGSPEKECPAVHVAGTNGKGSVCEMLRSIMVQAGYHTGLYTSPHLSSVRERFRIDEHYISEDAFARLMEKIRCALKGRTITYFECATALAFSWFAEQRCDLVIAETGMGGRLDATNVLNPLISVITTVSLDHQQYLGDSVESIAREKAGIIKRATPVISGELDSAPRAVIEQSCRDLGAPLLTRNHNYFLEPAGGNSWRWRDSGGVRIEGLSLPAGGLWQAENAASAIAAAVELRDSGFVIPDDSIRLGLQKASWPGRMELLEVEAPACGSGAAPSPDSPEILHFLLDGAHNEAGVRLLVETLETFAGYDRIVLIWASMGDKNYSDMLNAIARKADYLLLTRPDSERAATPEQLAAALDSRETRQYECVETVAEALARAKVLASTGDLVVVAGSLYLIGEFRKLLVGEVVG